MNSDLTYLRHTCLTDVWITTQVTHQPLHFLNVPHWIPLPPQIAFNNTYFDRKYFKNIFKCGFPCAFWEISQRLMQKRDGMGSWVNKCESGTDQIRKRLCQGWGTFGSPAVAGLPLPSSLKPDHSGWDWCKLLESNNIWRARIVWWWLLASVSYTSRAPWLWAMVIKFGTALNLRDVLSCTGSVQSIQNMFPSKCRSQLLDAKICHLCQPLSNEGKHTADQIGYFLFSCSCGDILQCHKRRW